MTIEPEGRNIADSTSKEEESERDDAHVAEVNEQRNDPVQLQLSDIVPYSVEHDVPCAGPRR